MLELSSIIEGKDSKERGRQIGQAEKKVMNRRDRERYIDIQYIHVYNILKLSKCERGIADDRGIIILTIISF